MRHNRECSKAITQTAELICCSSENWEYIRPLQKLQTKWETGTEARRTARLFQEGVHRFEIHSKWWMEQRDKEKNNELGREEELKGFPEIMGQRMTQIWEFLDLYWDQRLKSLHFSHCLNAIRFAEVKCWPAGLMCLLASEDKRKYS